MATRPQSYVLDSWAILAYLEDEPAGEAVELLITQAHEREIPLLMSVVNGAEVWYSIARNATEARANQRLAELSQLGINFLPADWSLAMGAAAFKAKHSMSLADCFAAAVAKQTNSELVTGDPEFRLIEKDVKIVWLKP